MTMAAAILVMAVLCGVLIVRCIRRQDFQYRDVLLFVVALTIPLRATEVLTFAGGNVRLGDLFLLLAIVAAGLEWLIVDRGVRLTQLDVLLIVFVLWCFCSMAWSLDPVFGLKRAMTYVRDLFLFGVVAYWSRGRFPQAFRAVSAGVLGSFVYLLGNTAFRLLTGNAAAMLSSGKIADLTRFRGESGLGGLTFAFEGTVLVVAWWTNVAIFFWLALGAWMSERRSVRIGFSVVLCALLWLEVMTFARGGWLGLAIGLVCWAVWIGRDLRRKLLVPAAVLFVALVLITYKLDVAHIVVQRVESFITSNADEAIDRRFEFWSRSLEALESHPMGLGIGGTNGVIFPKKGIWFVHNLYLQLLAELGPIGLALVLGIFAVALEKTIRAARVLPDRNLRIAGASLAAIFVAYLVTGTTYFDFSDLAIWLLIALASAVPRAPGG